MLETLHPYLCTTEFIDSETPTVKEYVLSVTDHSKTNKDKAIDLYYAIRDKIDYDVYNIDLSRSSFKASSTIERGTGFCIHKSIVLASTARAVGIPARLAFFDVRNHLSTVRLRRLIGGDIFHYHACTELYLGDRWVKATPVFNRRLCILFGIDPIEFDGKNDSTLHPYDRDGRVFMEFLHDHGTFEDLPYGELINVLNSSHPGLFTTEGRTASGSLVAEISNENGSKA